MEGDVIVLQNISTYNQAAKMKAAERSGLCCL
jgi:hypothetical protein